jgi:hypothetical protein
VTDFYFQRLQNDAIAPLSQRIRTPSEAVWSKPPAPGIPPIRLTSLETPEKETAKASSTSGSRSEGKREDSTAAEEQLNSKSAQTTPAASRSHHQARRFHLARHISSVLSPHAAGGIRKPKSFIRPPLATFIERHGAILDQDHYPTHSSTPIDRILEVPSLGASKAANAESGAAPSLETLQASKRTLTGTFVPPRSAASNHADSGGRSSGNKDLEAERLADELAALALEFDPELKKVVEAEHLEAAAIPKPQDFPMTKSDREEDFIYETYVRVPYNGGSDSVNRISSNYGILVIEEEDEDLWQKYLDNDEEDDWDEEDSNGE